MDFTGQNDFPGKPPEEGRLKLNRDPFGRCILRIVSERRGTGHDFFSDDDLAVRAANLLKKAASPEEQQRVLATIDRDLRIFNGYILKRDLLDIRPGINRFMARVKEAMRQGNCVPFLPDIQSASQKTYEALGRIIELSLKK